jgi:hypothetical protein
MNFASISVLSFLVIFSTGCAVVPAGSYNSRGPAVPISEVGARAAAFSGQATQFHQATQSIELCPGGASNKKGSGSTSSGLGDNNGQVTYNITTTSGNRQECNFGAGK